MSGEVNDVVVVGGGFFGMYIAENLARRGLTTVLVEKESDFMQRASFVNQARVHQGYHYPRSILTALRSRVSLPRFSEEFAECVDDQVDSYYLIGKILGKVTAAQFAQFCQRIGAPCEPAPHAVAKLTNPKLVEAVFRCVEFTFDAVKLKARMQDRLQAAGVQARLGTRVSRVARASKPDADGAVLEVHLGGPPSDQDERHPSQEELPLLARRVFNCTYSMLNDLLTRSLLPPIPLKHELTEIALVEAPPELQGKALTTMCGPFFSIMPFPSAGLHSLTHVRYTPHCEWVDAPARQHRDAHAYLRGVSPRSAHRAMQLDAQRYVPVIGECRYRRSLWEVKTVLPRAEGNDARPILFRPNQGLEGMHCVVGGKIDNVYDAVDAIDAMGLAS